MLLQRGQTRKSGQFETTYKPPTGTHLDDDPTYANDLPLERVLSRKTLERWSFAFASSGCLLAQEVSIEQSSWHDPPVVRW